MVPRRDPPLSAILAFINEKEVAVPAAPTAATLRYIYICVYINMYLYYIYGVIEDQPILHALWSKRKKNGQKAYVELYLRESRGA